MTRYIGFIGAKGSGKSTAFNFLHKRFSNLNEVMIARRLKKTCASIARLPEDYFNHPALKEEKFAIPYKLTEGDMEYLAASFGMLYEDVKEKLLPHVGTALNCPRHLAQYVGTEIIRSINPEAHLNMAALSAEKDKLNIVTDIRFMNELNYFKERDKEFILCYIQRKSAEEEASKDSHASEHHLQELAEHTDIVVYNNSSLEQFKLILEVLASTIYSRGGRWS